MDYLEQEKALSHKIEEYFTLANLSVDPVIAGSASAMLTSTLASAENDRLDERSSDC
jgi:hypothetical protein